MLFFKNRIKYISFFLFAIFTVSIIFVKKPWEDEAMFSCASYYLMENGYLAVPMFYRDLGTLNLDKYVYWIPPLNMLIGGLSYKIFGYSIFNRRFLSFIFGLLGLITFYNFLKKLNFDEKIISISILLTSVDFIYTRYSADGRLCDIMCSTLCLIGFWVYILLRKNFFHLAIFFSNLFITLACLTHPNGLLGFAGIVFLILFFDFKKIKISSVFVFILPYIIGIVSISFYILKDVDAFLSQFWFGNVLTAGKQNFFELIKNEFVKRYGMIYFGLIKNFPTLSRLLGIIPLLYFSSLIYMWFKRKENVAVKIMFYLTLIYFLVMTFILAKKWNVQYLIFIIPFYNFGVAFLYSSFRKQFKFLTKFVLVVIILLHTGVNFYRIVKNDYGKYISDLNNIKKFIGENEKVYGPLELGFFLTWERVCDDNTLGKLSKTEFRYLISSSDYNFIKTYKQKNILYAGTIYNLYELKK